jgi:hypothetical protein
MTHDELLKKIDDLMFKQVIYQAKGSAQLALEIWDIQKEILAEIKNLYDDRDALVKYQTQELVEKCVSVT